MDFQPGQQLLHYRLAEKVGEGGMGVVWRARDTSLDRDVAIKVLPDVLGAEPERMARFEREARLLALLDHPNIASVYGLHEAEGRRFIAMEYVPGEDLAQRLERGPLAVEDAIEIATQIAMGLEAAHEQGVIHRDLKPANVKRTPEGKIKVLDLGLAKALASETSDSSSVSLSPTMTTAGTVAGTLLGTAAYMSPEQAKGRTVDRRADIWAFGCVLYEMLTGKTLFKAETISETLAAVLRDDVGLQALPDDTPPQVAALLHRCLDRDPRRRLRDIGEARIALQSDAPATLSSAGEAAVAATPSVRSSMLPWVLAAGFAVLALASVWWAASRPVADPADMVSLIAPFPRGMRLPSDQMGVMALSPDGKTLAVVLDEDNQKRLYLRQLDTPGQVEVPGTEDAATPFFSPDGAWVGFFADNKLKKIAVRGGAPITLCEADGNNRGATWGSDDVITFSPHFTQPLMRVSGAGGDPVPLTTIDADAGERTHRWPFAVRGEDLVLFTVGTIDSPESYDGARIDAIRPSTGERRTVLERASMAVYASSGHLLFGREGFLFAVPFDLDRLETHDGPVPVMENVTGMRSSGVVHVGLSDNGMLAYIAGAPRSREYRLAWRYRDGRVEPLSLPVGGYVNPRLSPDRRRAALEIEGSNTFDIWTLDLEQSSLTRLTFAGDNTLPVWSPDGKQIAFMSVRDDALGSIYVKASDGSGEAQRLFSPDQLGRSAGQINPAEWIRDGRRMIVAYSDENDYNVGVLEDGKLEPILATPVMEAAPRLSPNEAWLAYMSDESGGIEVYVRSLIGGGKWQVSVDGGINPRWSPDGKALFYRDGSQLLGVAVDGSGGGFRAGRPYVVLDNMSPSSASIDYCVYDANRFLVIEELNDDAAPDGVTVVVHWFDELERRVSSRR